MNLEKYFDNVSPLSPPQSCHSSTDVATNSSITSPESETPYVTSSLLNLAMGEEFVIPEDRLLRDEYIRNGPFKLKLPNDSYPKTSFHGGTFVKDVFRQWPHALEKNRGFNKHSKSEIHSISPFAWKNGLVIYMKLL